MKRLLIAASAIALATLAPDASAFCGFYVAPQDGPLYNDATMVALMREGTRTAMSMSNNYKGPAADFAMVVPVPIVLQKENVKTLPKDIFTHLEALTAPRLVEYWEQDPCNPYPEYMAKGGGVKMPTASAAPAKKASDADYGVKIEAKFTVGEYNILVLSAKQSDGLEQWLHDNKYKVPKGASAALAPYIKEQWKFFVAKIDVKKVQMDAQGVAVLSPLRFHYESQDFRLPVRLGLLNSAGRQDLLIYVLSSTSRYDVANYANVFIPTNLEVVDETRKSFASFYATLFDEAIYKAGGRAVVTEYSWATSSCDPCPTPPLQQSELATLGGDVLLGMGTPPSPSPSPPPPTGGAPVPPPMKKKPSMGWGGFQPMTVTRLHTRYDPTTLGDDLVFRAAAAVVGGREHVVDDKGSLEKGAQLSSTNNFQARYIIRHKWAGPIKCQNPQRGIWGGPPGGSGAPPAPAPATNLAAAPRGNVKLASLLKAGMPAFEITPASSVLPTIVPPDAPDAGPDDAAVVDAAIAPPEAADASAAPVPSVEPNAKSGCGCDVPGGGSAGGGLAGIAFALWVSARLRSRLGGKR